MPESRPMTDPERTLLTNLSKSCKTLLEAEAADIPAGVTTPANAVGEWPRRAVLYARVQFLSDGSHPGPWKIRVTLHDPPRSHVVLRGEHSPVEHPKTPFLIDTRLNLETLPIPLPVMQRIATELRAHAETARNATIARRRTAREGTDTSLQAFFDSYV